MEPDSKKNLHERVKMSDIGKPMLKKKKKEQRYKDVS